MRLKASDELGDDVLAELEEARVFGEFGPELVHRRLLRAHPLLDALELLDHLVNLRRQHRHVLNLLIFQLKH